MQLRKLLTVGAAVFTAGLLTLGSGIAQASPPHGPVAGVQVNGSTPSSPVAINGIFKSGTATFAGITAGCSGGSTAGTVGAGASFNFTALNITCDSPLGIDANISLASGCSISATSNDAQVHPGLIDDGVKGSDPDPVSFGASTIASNCIVVTIDGGCTFRVDGTMELQFKETPKTVGGVTYQDLVLKGNGLRTRSPNFLCFGLIPTNGIITLNNITFNVKVATGSVVTPGTPPTGAIDFRP